ncbi:MAG TPA: amino acid ABC transporter permease [Candidatus Limnocylindria bacterium]|nr:amino acid ABC transporter permease [Candidatus Limnocylindria bacterium]
MSGETVAQADQPTVVERLARAKVRARRLFRFKFFVVWVVLVAGFGVAFWFAGRVDPEFLRVSGPIIILRGVQITILLCLSSIVLATILAVLGALGRLSTNAYINGVASLYVSVVRGTPLLVQILFIYFGLPQLGIVLPAIPAGIIALSFNYGAYMTEIFRAGIQAVPPGQREAAAALGMPEHLIMRRIVLPQAIRIVVPAIGNEFIAMLKDSALVSVIAVQELLWWAQRLGRSALQPMTGLLLAAVVYWILTMAFSLLQERLERRLARSDR